MLYLAVLLIVLGKAALVSEYVHRCGPIFFDFADSLPIAAYGRSIQLQVRLSPV